jgi:hypothetical protein
MGVYHSGKEIGDGHHIEGRGISIDIVVLEIEGPCRDRTARFKIEGHPRLNEFWLSRGDEPFNLWDGLSMDLNDNSYRREVNICYNIHRDYKIQPL